MKIDVHYVSSLNFNVSFIKAADAIEEVMAALGFSVDNSFAPSFKIPEWIYAKKGCCSRSYVAFQLDNQESEVYISAWRRGCCLNAFFIRRLLLQVEERLRQQMQI